jgi:UDP-glucose:(heptosyl)LPS alpha-1,3-glucosyltransferase
MATGNKIRIAVVTPFLDKQHGTERCVAEQVERLARHYEIHVYSNYVKDVDPTKIVWHRVPSLPGPHLFGYIWWLAANHFQRWWDAQYRGLKFNLIYSPGINCLDADLISVHIVFSEFCEHVKNQLKLKENPIAAWPRVLHRQLYYWLARKLEYRTYSRDDLPLVVVSHKVAADLARYYGHKSNLPLVYHGWDRGRFGSEACSKLRIQARHELQLRTNDFVLLLIGNDLNNKGLRCLLEAAGQLRTPELRILVVGDDTSAPYVNPIQRTGLAGRVQFLPLRRDVEFYYAAADTYVGPSLHDAFAMPPLEAMACGLPVIVSRQAGVSEVITHESDGYILENPQDAAALASMIRNLYNDAELRKRLGENASRTALKYTWDRNADQLREVFEGILENRMATTPCPDPVSC